MKRMRALLSPKGRDERGVESVAMIIVLPTMFVLLIALLEVGFYMRTRMLLENELRDTVRRVAADGGNNWAVTNEGGPWDASMKRRIYDSTRGNPCMLSRCTAPPVVDCTQITTLTGNTFNREYVDNEGDTVTCTVEYHYQPLAEALLNGPLGLGTGSLIRKDFTLSSSARAETGPGL